MAVTTHARSSAPASQETVQLQLVVRIGFTGHRDLGECDPESLRRELGARLAEVRDAAAGIAREHPAVFDLQPRVQLYAGVAAGADQAACLACLDLGLELVAVSPFAWEEFERDFEGDPAGLERARAIWSAPGVEHVELEASVVRPGPTREQRFHEGGPHYEALGRFVVGQSDLVLAFLDPARESGGAGGARRVLEQAEAREIPRLLVRPDAGGYAAELAVTRGAATLPAALRRVVAPPAAAVRGTGGAEREATPGKRPTYFVGDYRREVPVPRRSVFARAASRAFDAVVERLGGTPRGLSRGRAPDRDPEFLPPALVDELDRADGLANHYNGLHRACFLAIYLLGFLAVFSAVVGHLDEKHWSEGSQVEHVQGAEIGRSEGAEAAHADGAIDVHGPSPWTFVEIASLGAVLGLFLLARRARFREKGTDYRLLAEMFRVAVSLWPVRTRIRFHEPRVQGSDGAVVQTWMAWYARACVRQLGPVGARFDSTRLERCTEALRQDLVEDQVRFHSVRVHRYSKLEGLINVVVLVLFVAAIVGCGIHFLPESWQPALDMSLVLTAALPALAAALHGIATHAEFSRLERRYHAMGEYLESVLVDLPEGKTLSRHELESIVQEVSGRMLDEVAEWRWLHAVHDPKL